jgi:hypothetical protein
MTSNNTPADIREAAAKIALSWTPVDGHAVQQHPLESPCGWTRRCIANAIRNMPLPPVKQSLTTDATIGSQSTVEFVQEWMMSGDYEADDWTKQFAAAIDARASIGSHAGDHVGEAFTRLCEELGIPATAGAYLEVRSRRAMPLPDGGKLREALELARPIVEADYVTACEYADADWLGPSKEALDAIDEALADQAGKGGQLEPIDTVPGAGEGSL